MAPCIKSFMIHLMVRLGNSPQLPDPVLCARANLDLEHENVQATLGGVEWYAILGDTGDRGRRADEAECHVDKRVERELRSRVAERDDEREVLVLRNPLLAGKTLMSEGLVSGHATAVKL